MVSQYEVEKSLEGMDTHGYIYDKENGVIILEETNEVLCSIEKYTDRVRKELHCSFEGVYSCPASLINVLKCTECGTVIFSYDDERYDHSLVCPICSEENIRFEYWTQEEIDSDEIKQNTINMYEEMTQRRIAIYEREKRTGLYSL